MTKKYLITGAAGFIGSNLVDTLLSQGHSVVGVDNLSTGRIEFLKSAVENKNFKLVQADLLQPGALNSHLNDTHLVFHLAANADVRHGLEHPTRDLEQNTIVTSNVLESVRLAKVKNFAFSSTGSVYGEAPVIPTPEEAPFPIQTSLYGASKLAGEALISAYSEGYGIKATVFRFVSILGERYTHGHVFDFIKNLKANPKKLKVLGDGSQRKSYLYVKDCIRALLMATDYQDRNKFEVYNLGTDEYTNVNQSISTISEILGVKPELEYTGGDRGWVGDNPFIFLECSKIKKIGWKAEVSIKDGVVKTAQYLLENPWVYNQ